MVGWFRVYRHHRRQKRLAEVDNLIGRIGMASTQIDSAGRILISGEYWSACADVSIPRGSFIRVTGWAGLKLRVDRYFDVNVHDAPIEQAGS